MRLPSKKHQNNNNRKGHLAEFLASLLLRLKGFSILEKRYKNKYGEIDLIARRRSLLIFVEVKYRPSTAAALASIQFKQRRRIENASQMYLISRKVKSDRIRFDAIVLSGLGMPKHFPDAWRLGE